MRRTLLKWALGVALLLALAGAVSVVCSGLGSAGDQAAAAGTANTPVVSANIVNTTASPVPVAGAVKVNNAVDSPVPVTGTVTVNSAPKSPTGFYVNTFFYEGDTTIDNTRVVSEAKWFVVQTVSVTGWIPVGQTYNFCNVIAFKGDYHAVLCLVPDQYRTASAGYGQFCCLNPVACTLYVPPGGGLSWDVGRSADSGTANLEVHLSGYLADTP